MNALRRLTDGVLPQAVITGSLSFAHIHDLAKVHGQTGWKAWTYPLSVDLLMVAAYKEVLKARHAKDGGTLLPWVWFLLALGASLTANVIATGGRDPLSIAVGVWPAVAFLGCTLLGHSHPAPTEKTESTEARETASTPAPAVHVNAVQVAQESADLTRAVEGSAVAALAPAEPKTPAPAVSPTSAPAPPEVAPELLDYAARIAAEHQDRHGQPIPLAALRSRLGVSPALAQTVHAHVTA